MKNHIRSKYINHKSKCGRDIIDYPKLILLDDIKKVTCKSCKKIYYKK